MKKVGTLVEESRNAKLDKQLARINEIAAKAKLRADEQKKFAQAEEAERRKHMVVQLPLWADEVRALPNESCRAALFTVRRARKRRVYTDESIFVVGDGKIGYTGIELRAENDELVWLQVLHYAKDFPLGRWVEFTPYQLCKDIGWTPTGPNYKLLRECLLRLKATALTVESKRLAGGLALSLIGDFLWKDAAGKVRTRYAVQVPAEIREWFGEHNFTRLHWEIYRNLPPVARRLYDYAASHRDPYALKAETVYQLCGSDAESIENFRKILRRNVTALDESGLLKKVDMTRTGLVRFVR